jgi:DNA-binding MarR family transcriptional regulator
MPHKTLTPAGKALTDLILEVFRLNGRLLLTGDRLVAGLGLTSARWQVLGAVAFAREPQPVARLARSMGLNRQGVQRIANEMESAGLVEFLPNPHHRRAKLVALTGKGRQTYAAADALQIPWVNGLADRLSAAEITAATRLAEELRTRLEAALRHDRRDDD